MAESRYIGKVRWFNKTKGYGMITREDNGIDVFVHFSNIATDGFKNLSEGEPVEFSITPYEKGVQATNVISISPSVQKTNLPTLKVFLCHSSGDKPVVRDLYQRLKSLRVDPWLDEEKILPGQDWNIEITKAVRNSDIVIVCLSKGSISKTGYIQKEIKYALDVADEQPDGTIFIIPLKIEECEVPERLRRWQWVNLFDENGYQRLSNSLKLRAKEKGVLIS